MPTTADMHLIAFRTLALETMKLDYKDPFSFQDYNRAIEGMRNSASYINSFAADRIPDFVEMLNDESAFVRRWCAICFIELIKFNDEQLGKALSVIKGEITRLSLPETEEINKNINRELLVRWLKNWEDGKVATAE